jgi:hypothetical protein
MKDNKQIRVNVLIFGLLIVGAMAVVLLVFLIKAKEEFPDHITVSQDGVTESILPVRNLKLHPSESKEYSVNLVCAASGGYHIYLDFEETQDGGMKHFVNVSVSVGGELTYEGSLLGLLDGDEVVYFERELYEVEPQVITISYLMPHEIGNEAQGTYADFDVHLKIKKS